ncbi:MAG: pyrroloquinoline-quinone synthase [Chloroflexota bacterium]|jgi:pyrroloquinoline-quinone synthase|nr:pyrroloquinoline-quinone synthase [Chloroflexota bacterium]
MTAMASSFAQELYGVVAARHSKDHPLIGMIERGELTRAQLLGFSVQFYQLFAKIFPKPIAALYARCPDDPDVEKHLLENLLEEGTGQVSGSKSHRDLFLDFGQALGLPPAALDAAEPLPETAALLNWRDVLFYQRPWIEAMAAQGYALEGTAAERMKRIVRGLRTHYDIAPEAMGYWTVHIEVEDEHGSVGALAVERFADTEEKQAAVRDAVQRTLDVFWLVFDGIVRCYVDEEPSYARWRDWLRANTRAST